MSEEYVMHRFVFRARRSVKCEAPGGVKIDFPEGHEIDCYEGFKFQPEEMARMFEGAGLKQSRMWKAPEPSGICESALFLVQFSSPNSTLLTRMRGQTNTFCVNNRRRSLRMMRNRGQGREELSVCCLVRGSCAVSFGKLGTPSRNLVRGSWNQCCGLTLPKYRHTSQFTHSRTRYYAKNIPGIIQPLSRRNISGGNSRIFLSNHEVPHLQMPTQSRIMERPNPNT